MFDAWMNSWTERPQTVVTGWTAMQDAVPSVTDGVPPVWLTSMATPMMAPAMMAAATANAAAATWAGVWMGLAATPLAVMGASGAALVSEPPKKSEPARKTQPAKTAAKAKAATAKRASAKAPAAKPARTKAAATKAPKLDDRPAGFDAPRGGKADDLKKISGVGPKLETVLNDLGIYHFDQIAAWKAAEIAWVDDYLRFKGRIKRDGWINQAKTLTKEAV
ncbi:MAG: NADH:quinone oxidoreductase [Pseudomonadota bacterium]